MKQNQITATPVLITPQMASVFLRGNEGNRTIRHSKVKDYAATMKKGQWKLTHQGIALSPDGRILDGQHRLLAIVDANVSVQVMVTKGFSDEIYGLTDLGIHRDSADRLGIGKNVAAVIGLACKVTAEVWGMTSIEQLKQMESLIGEKAQALVDRHGAGAVYFSCSQVKLAAVCCAIQNKQDDYAFDAYGAMVASRIDNMPPPCKMWLTRYTKKLISTKDKYETLSWACLALNKKNETREKLPREFNKERYGTDFVRSVLRPLMK